MSVEIVTLVNRCLAGEQTAVVELVHRYQGLVFGLCYRMLGHRHDAEDVTQEVFLRMVRSLARWDSTREFKPWLLAIAGNRCRTMLANRQKRPQPASLEYQVTDDSPTSERANHLWEEVDLALASLRDEYRQAFQLFHQEQLSYIEIAAALEVPVGTVKTWVHRARKQLAGQLIQRGVVEQRNPEPAGAARVHLGTVGVA